MNVNNARPPRLRAVTLPFDEKQQTREATREYVIIYYYIPINHYYYNYYYNNLTLLPI